MFVFNQNHFLLNQFNVKMQIFYTQSFIFFIMPDKICFIIMPVTTPEHTILEYGDDEHFKHVMNCLFIPALKKARFTAIKPITTGSNIIHEHIISQLISADLVLCDMSTQNPNVFFELGIRTALNKPVCLVKDELFEKVPFDTSLINYHTYSSNLRIDLVVYEIEKLARHIENSFNQSNNSNTLWKTFGLQYNAKPPEKLDASEKLDLLNIKLDTLIKQKNEKPIIPPSELNKKEDYRSHLGFEYNDKMSKISQEMSRLLHNKYKMSSDVSTYYSYVTPNNTICVHGKIKEIPKEALIEFESLQSHYGIKIEYIEC